MTVNKKTVTSFLESLERIEKRYQAGLAPALDLYQAKQSLNKARINQTELEGKLAATEHGLAILLGKFPGDSLSGKLAILPELPSLFPAGLPADLLNRRPDLQAAGLRVMAQDERVGAALADRLPSINLMANYGLAKTNTAGTLTDTFWNLAAGITQPIIDGGRRKAAEQRNRAALEEAVARYQKSLLRAILEVEDTLTANHSSEQRLKLLEDQLSLTQASLNLTETSYSQGTTDYLGVLIAQRNLMETQQQYLTAHQQLISDRISLARALGGEWMEETLQNRLSDIQTATPLKK